MAKKSLTKHYLNQVEYKLFEIKKYIIQRVTASYNKEEKPVVFVAGVQRSGTNMMMDVIERSYETDVYHERDIRAFDNYQMRPVAVIRELYNNSCAPVFVIKTLCELQDLTQLMHDFSPSKAVWVLRDYNDVVNSMLVSFNNQAEQVKRIAKYRTSDGWLSAGMSDETYSAIKELAHDGLDDASAAALSWYFRNILFFEQGFDRNVAIRLVKYERLVSNAETEFNKLFDFLNLKYSKRISSKVFSSSIRRKSVPVIEQPIRILCDKLTQRFETVLENQDR